MDMNDSRRIAAEPALVWQALLDPDVLKEAVPGCEELTGSADEGYAAVVLQKVGPVKARFKGAIKITDITEGESATLQGEGKGGAAGFARGEARVRLAPTEQGTQLSYEVDAKVGGKLAQLGSRIIDGFARKLADQFFERFQAAVEGPGAEDAAEGAPEDSADTDQDSDGAKPRGWLKRMTGR